MEPNLIDLYHMASVGILTTIGAIAHYLRKIDKDELEFNTISFITNTVVAFFVGNVVDVFGPNMITGWTDYSGGILLICGFYCHPILGAIDSKVRAFIAKA